MSYNNATVNRTKDKITDLIVIFSLLKIWKFIHDSIEVFDPEQKKNEISEILIKFIRKIDFGIDFENYLTFLTEARASYSDLPKVIELLIKEVQKIVINIYKILKGKHNKKNNEIHKNLCPY